MKSTLAKRFVSPQIVVSQFHIHPGSTVVDLGVGSGYFLPELVKAVGESGTVYACDIQKGLIESVGELVREKGWENVRPVWCDIDEEQGTTIPEQTADVAILVNTFFQLENKRQAIVEISRILKDGGRLLVVDWSESFQGLGPAPDQVISKEETINLLEADGFALDREYPAGEHHYGLAFRKTNNI